MKIYYHSADLDGHCSGALVRKAYPEGELVGINYGDEFDFDSLVYNEKVFMVDFCLQPFDLMEKLNRIVKLTWIDHHKSAIEEAKSRNFIAGNGQKLEIGRAACELTLEYLFPYPQVKNETVYLIGRYDVWNLVPNTLELQNGLGLYDTLPTNTELWNDLLSQDSKILKEALHNGKVLLQKQKMDNEAYVKSYAFETEIDGLKVIAINKGLTDSQIFESIRNNEKYDAMLCFVWRKTFWTISLYTDKENIDVSKICEVRGGGGHKQAAGFQCEVLPFLLKGE